MSIWTKISKVTTPTWTAITEITTPTWVKITEITTPTWTLVSAWVWEHRLIEWQDANTKWEDAG